jgi:hypothetical protein
VDDGTGANIGDTCHLLDGSNHFIDLDYAGRVDFNRAVIRAIQEEGTRDLGVVAAGERMTELKDLIGFQLEKNQGLHGTLLSFLHDYLLSLYALAGRVFSGTHHPQA